MNVGWLISDMDMSDAMGIEEKAGPACNGDAMLFESLIFSSQF